MKNFKDYEIIDTGGLWFRNISRKSEMIDGSRNFKPFDGFRIFMEYPHCVFWIPGKMPIQLLDTGLVSEGFLELVDQIWAIRFGLTDV